MRETRAAILDAAEQLVGREGVSALTFEAVAREVDISKGGVLHHFPSKEELALAMLERAIAEFDAAVMAAAEAEGDAPGRFARAYVRASLGLLPRANPDPDRLTASVTTALLGFPQHLEPVRAQGARHQAALEADGLDRVRATLVRLCVDGLWLAENFGLMRYDPALRRAVTAALLAMTQPDPAAPAAPATPEPDRCPA